MFQARYVTVNVFTLVILFLFSTASLAISVFVTLPSLPIPNALSSFSNPGPQSSFRGPRDTDRRLALFADVAPKTTATSRSGCVNVSLATPVSLNLASASECNGNKCPPCFIFQGCGASCTVTFLSCSSMMVSKDTQLGVSGGRFEFGFSEFRFLNSNQAARVTIIDGQGNQMVLRKGEMRMAACTAVSGNAFVWYNQPQVYVLGGTDSQHCPAESIQITSAAQCEYVVRSVEYNVAAVTFATQSKTTKPKGCYSASLQGSAAWNSAVTGTGGAAKRPICRSALYKPGDLPD